MFDGVQKVIWDAIFGIINMLVSSFTKPIFDTTASLHDLIYGVEGANNYGILSSSDIANAYSPSFTIMYRLAAFFVLIAIIVSAYKTSGMAINPTNRTQVIEFWKDFLIIAVVLWNIEFLYQIIFNFNSTLVHFFGDLIKDKYEGSIYGKTVNVSDLVKSDSPNYFYLICLNLIEAGLRIWATFFYTMRKITMLILMILGPVMISLWLLPRYKAVTMGWLKELFGTIIVQSIHAFVFWLIIQINIGTDETSLVKILILIMFIPITEQIRGLFGLGGNMQNGMSKIGAMTGLRTLAGLAAVTKGAMDGKSISEMVRGGVSKLAKNAGQGSNIDDADKAKPNIPGANTGTDTGTTAAASRMLKAGQIMSKMGKATLGAAGTLMGSPLGPEGTLIGAGLGSAAGEVAGGLAGRAGYAALSKTGGALKGLGGQIGKSSAAAKDSFLKARGGQEVDDAALVEDWTTKDFETWKHDNPDHLLRDTLRKQFPSASNQQLDGMVGQRNKDMRQQFKNQNLAALGKTALDGREFAKADDLVNASTSAYADAYTRDNKAAFMSKLPESMSQEEKQNAWNSHLDGKTNTFRSMARSTAKELGALSDQHSLGNGKTAFDNSFIDKNGFTNAIQTKLSSQDGPGSNVMPNGITQAISSVQGQAIKNSDGTINRAMYANLSAQKFMAGQLSEGAGKALDPAAVATSYNMAHQTALSNPLLKAPTGVKEQAISITRGSIAGLDSFMKTMAQPVTHPAAVAYGLKVAEGGNGIQATLAAGKAIVNTSLGANDLQRQYNATKGVAYLGGVVAGVSGYQATANFASRVNPFNNSVQQQTMEIGQIEQSVSKVTDPKGQEVVRQGAVRLVTTTNQSYIEMTNQGGQKQIVSRCGSGDSSIPNGQVIYQDLNISNGQLVSYGNGSQAHAYIEDSTGSKLSINRALSINPNKLVANLNPTPLKVERIAAPSSYNAKVDSGSFFVADVEKGGFQNVQMVIERDKSYMVGTDTTGTVTRISPLGKGDTRLAVNQRIERTCEMVNKQFVIKEDTLINHGDQITVGRPSMNLSDYNPNNLIPITPNPRLSKRQAMNHEENIIGVSS